MSSSRVRSLAGIALTILTTAGVGVLTAPAAQAAPAASTGVATRIGNVVEYRTATGKFNNSMYLHAVRGGVLIDDTFPIKPGKGCKRYQNDQTKVLCSFSVAPSKIMLRIGTFDGHDDILNWTKLRMTAWTGAGNDHVEGSSSIDVIYGGTGGDRLSGMYGNDVVYGGPGRDTVSGGPDNDVVDGETDDDVVYGGQGDDRATGGPGKDEIYGMPGNDILSGQYGSDSADADLIDGGAHTDTCTKAPHDILQRCER